MNPFKIIKYELYLFQLENYEIWRFLRLVFRTWGRPKMPPRKDLVWTLKAKALFVTAIFLQAAVAWWLTKSFLGIVLFAAFFFVFFAFLVLASVVLRPLDYVLKSWIIFRAKRKIAKFKNLKIVGITGSFGKTTMKAVLAAILSQKFQVLRTPESVNTPVGIARLILKKLIPEIEIFIVEMGAYRRGDIRKLCQITPPDIAVLTGINEAHLERFGNLENTIAAKFEIVENSKPDALAVLNEDNKPVCENCKKYLAGREAIFYSSAAGRGEIYQNPFLGEYALGMIRAAVSVGEKLGMQRSEIFAGIGELRPVPHRLEPLKLTGDILAIDDSYNANPDGIREAVKVLSRYQNRRKIYLTPGLVEVGTRACEIHLDLGRNLAKVADLVILIKNSATPRIAQGLKEAGFSEDKIIWFESALQAHGSLEKILKAGDVILFQNDWPDNYL
jgi:UDP-N-acetylmuramoyl-tripeptide--D-alanyl-D-alanine ligase